jgi:hypothetical protein
MNDIPIAMSPELEDLNIRDYIAIQVLHVFVNNPETEYEEDAEDAYRVADAMLRVRARQ